MSARCCWDGTSTAITTRSRSWETVLSSSALSFSTSFGSPRSLTSLDGSPCRGLERDYEKIHNFPLMITYKRSSAAMARGSDGPPHRSTNCFKPCPPDPIMDLWYWLSMSITSVVSSPIDFVMSRIADLAEAMDFFEPRMVIVVWSPSPLSTSICASVLFLISLIVAPPLPSILATVRVGTSNLVEIFNSFSNSTASSNSALAPATPFFPPFTKTSSGLSCSRVLSPCSGDCLGKMILTEYLSSKRTTHFPFCPINEEWYWFGIFSISDVSSACWVKIKITSIWKSKWFSQAFRSGLISFSSLLERFLLDQWSTKDHDSWWR